MDPSPDAPWPIRLADALVRRLATTGISPSFLRFAMVGTAGFCWDTATIYALRGIAGLYVAGLAGFFVAVTANWALNRAWTFRGASPAALHRQWARFVAANAGGFVINRGLYFVLITINGTCRDHPVLAIMAGSAGGLILNYFLSKRFVFR